MLQRGGDVSLTPTSAPRPDMSQADIPMEATGAVTLTESVSLGQAQLGEASSHGSSALSSANDAIENMQRGPPYSTSTANFTIHLF